MWAGGCGVSSQALGLGELSGGFAVVGAARELQIASGLPLGSVLSEGSLQLRAEPVSRSECSSEVTYSRVGSDLELRTDIVDCIFFFIFVFNPSLLSFNGNSCNGSSSFLAGGRGTAALC